MPETGRAAQNEESYRRAIETAKVKPPVIIAFQAATRDQVLNALREEELHGKNPVLHLAAQGLYDPDRQDVIFHPENILDTGVAVQTGGEDSASYRIFQHSRERLLASIAKDPENLYTSSLIKRL